ncbi:MULTISPECIES: GNAT family N-acetyltransferase [unclassified Rhizobium]|uniref:GNAT family N-acetyltransferase n=1 Tax=unclassified Rhizobium TaxID=2613769 RepID=UPI001FFE06D8|nr:MULTISPECIES: GNAT family N-acetyltransferase [unclassified Rhizobium]
MNTQEISYRRIVPGEGSIFKQIWLQALRSTPSSYASILDDWESLSEDEWNRRLTDPVFGAFHSGIPVGLMGLIRRHPAKLKHRAIIVMAYVHADFRRTGTASALLNHVISFAKDKGISKLELCVSGENVSAIAFYRSQLFSDLCVVPGGIIENGKPVKEVQMIRSIGDLG